MVKTHLEPGNPDEMVVGDESMVDEEEVYPSEAETVGEEDVENINYDENTGSGGIPVTENDLSASNTVNNTTKRRYAPTNDTDYTVEQSYDYSPKSAYISKNSVNNTLKNIYKPQDNSSYTYVDNRKNVYKPKTNIYVANSFTNYAIEYLKFLKYMLKETFHDD